MKINFINKKAIKNYETTVQSLFDYAVKVLNISINNLEVTIEFVKPSKIKRLNNKFRGLKEVTDVLSFPNLNLKTSEVDKLSDVLVLDNFLTDVNQQTNNLYLGEILINLKQIKKQAKEYENTLERELGYIAVHGLLHLFGFDHLKESDKKKMRKYEEAILEGCGLER